LNNNINAPIQGRCLLCQSQGRQLYRSLSDHLFHSPGKWSFYYCPNIRCSLIWLVPKPTPEDMGSLYFNYYTHDNQAGQPHALKLVYDVARQGYLQVKYAYRHGAGSIWYRLLSFMVFLHPLGVRHAQATVLFLESPAPNNRLLDVGCGNGAMLDRMERLGWDVEGIETDPVAYKLAGAKRSKVYLSELAGRKYADDLFDVIILNHVLEHTSDPIRLIKECHRILKSSGRMVIVTPNALSFGHRHFKESWRGLEPPRHLYIFNTKNIRIIAEASGFDINRSRLLTRVTDMLAISLGISKDGNSEQSPNRPLTGRNIHSILLSYWERLLLVFDSSAGEELIFVARK